MMNDNVKAAVVAGIFAIIVSLIGYGVPIVEHLCSKQESPMQEKILESTKRNNTVGSVRYFLILSICTILLLLSIFCFISGVMVMIDSISTFGVYLASDEIIQGVGMIIISIAMLVLTILLKNGYIL